MAQAASSIRAANESVNRMRANVPPSGQVRNACHTLFRTLKGPNLQGSNMTSSTYDVVAVGNAIIDIIKPVSDTFLAEEGIVKGGMTLIDEARAELASRRAASSIIDPCSLLRRPLASARHPRPTSALLSP